MPFQRAAIAAACLALYVAACWGMSAYGLIAATCSLVAAFACVRVLMTMDEE